LSDKYLELVGERLFGRSLRLQVLAFVAAHPTGSTWQGEVCGAVNGKPTEIGKELDRLVAVGLLQPARRDSKASRKLYDRADDHPLWPPLTAVLEALHKAGP